MLLHRGADVRSLCDVCDVTFQGRVVRTHGEETPHHHEAVAAAQTAQHTSRADSVLAVFSGDPQKGEKTSSLAAAKRGRGNVLRRNKIPRPKVFHVDTKVFQVDTKINLFARK